MRSFLLTLLLGFPVRSACTQELPASSSVQNVPEFSLAMAGEWVGVLEYRDYSEPATSLKRVQLPTWLSIQPTANGFSLDYTYDDGPAKTVREHSVVVVNGEKRTYTITEENHPAQTLLIVGWEQLKAGKGTLTLTGSGTDNKQPAEFRTTLIVRRNLLSWLEEVRLGGANGPFSFRHRYTFTRSIPPKAK